MGVLHPADLFEVGHVPLEIQFDSETIGRPGFGDRRQVPSPPPILIQGTQGLSTFAAETGVLRVVNLASAHFMSLVPFAEYKS